MSRKIIDLSITCSNETEGFTTTLQDDLPIYMGQECYAYDVNIKSHIGTYFETSSHVFRDGKDTNDVAIDDLILPGVCVKIVGENKCIDADDLEKACGKIKSHSALLIDVAGHTDKYFSRDAAVWMAEKKVAIMGSNTNRYDSGFENPTGFFIDLFTAEIPIIHGLCNLEVLPKQSFTLIVLPLKITNVCTIACRVVAMPKNINGLYGCPQG